MGFLMKEFLVLQKIGNVIAQGATVDNMPQSVNTALAQVTEEIKLSEGLPAGPLREASEAERTEEEAKEMQKELGGGKLMVVQTKEAGALSTGGEGKETANE